MDRYCKIYVDYRGSSQELKRLVESCVNLENVDIYIDYNEEFDAIRACEFPDGFLFFKFFLELDFDEGVNFLCVVNLILRLFWDRHISAVASCDYENLLINSGGYRIKECFWNK